ncbi:uncharacterized protein LOC142984644 [Anticarsia gemmatalis]|uniref:uncharacterized protein LOC142984644 n=1 Tax=Anticarsia gemmatalis TaxID=129554 RepID=UPI003F75F8BB
MATGGSGAVFFLGTRAHYQVLNQPETHFDVENGNTSTETIYQNPSVQELWPRDQASVTSVQELWPRDQASVTSVQELWPRDQNASMTSVQELWPREQKLEVDNERWGYCDQTEVTLTTEREKPEGATKRLRRRTSETALCDRDDMKPALLNSVNDSPPQKKCTKAPLFTFLMSLARRKRKLDTDDIQYLHHIDNALGGCTYRESCRCLDCQSRYFECDDSDEEEDYSSDDSYVPRYIAQVMEAQETVQPPPPPEEDEDDEVFIDTVPGDNTSTDLLLDTKMSVSSDETTEATVSEAEHNLQLEVAAGTPVLLNYLLTHPITCAIQ